MPRILAEQAYFQLPPTGKLKNKYLMQENPTGTQDKCLSKSPTLGNTYHFKVICHW
jgi:hypothetical protein